MGPGVAVVPVHVAGLGEIGVEGGRVGDVADEGVDEEGVCGKPGWVQRADYGTG